MFDVKVFLDDVLKSVDSFVRPAFKAIDARLDALAEQIKAIPAGPRGEAGEKGECGLNGKDGAPGRDGATGSQGEKGDPGLSGKDGASGPAGKDGAPGERGEPGAKGDPGIDGEDGVPGRDGEKGEPGARGEKGEPGDSGAMGKDGIDGGPGPQGEKGDPGPAGKDCSAEEVAALLMPQLKGMVDTIPKPQDGKDGKDGKDGDPGKSVTVEEVLPTFELAMTKSILEFERRMSDAFQRAVDRIPVPKDGADGLSLEDLTVEHDGDGLVTFKFERGELKKEFTLRFPRFKDRGGYMEGKEFREGDGVSFGGSLFLAQKDGILGKPGESDDWRCAVKKGRDGKDFTPSEPKRAEPVRLK